MTFLLFLLVYTFTTPLYDNSSGVDAIMMMMMMMMLMMMMLMMMMIEINDAVDVDDRALLSGNGYIGNTTAMLQ